MPAVMQKTIKRYAKHTIIASLAYRVYVGLKNAADFYISTLITFGL